MSQSQFLLFESASGYGLFEVTASDELSQGSEAVQRSVADLQRFGKAVKLIAFKPFTSAANALEQINAVSESQVGGSGPPFGSMHVPLQPLCWALGRLAAPACCRQPPVAAGSPDMPAHAPPASLPAAARGAGGSGQAFAARRLCAALRTLFCTLAPCADHR